MGVEGLKNFFLRKGYGSSFIKELPPKINSLFIDCNGIFYAAAGKIYHLPDDKDDEEKAMKKLAERKKLVKKSKANLEKLHIKTIIQIFENTINEYKPSENLILAIDGIVNSAKLNQQKPRRFKKASETVDPTVLIDTISITPGTSFMVKLDVEIEKWLDSYDGFKPRNIIYSSHLSPGEGEHKIFEYIRRGELDTSGNNVIFGMDNDLIILSMLSGLENFYLVPDRKDEKGKGNVLSVDNLKNQIIDKMKFENCDENILIKDFSVLVMFVGNDFLHRFPNVGRLNDLVPFLFLIYSKFLKKHLTDSDNRIIWKNYLQLLIFYENYKISQGRGQKYLDIYLKKSYTTNYPELEESILVTDKSGNPVNQVYDYRIHNLKFDENLFSKNWYKKQFNPEIIQYNLKTIEEHTNKDIVKMCINYLQMVQWVQFYYTEGLHHVSNLQFYHYIYNPLMGSVIKVLKLLIKENKLDVLYNVTREIDNIEITVIHQLMAVIPPQSIELIPEQYRKIYKKELGKINVENFKISKEGTWKDHQAYPILPKTNIDLIDKSLRKKKFVLPKELEEKEDIIYKTD